LPDDIEVIERRYRFSGGFDRYLRDTLRHAAAERFGLDPVLSDLLASSPRTGFLVRKQIGKVEGTLHEREAELKEREEMLEGLTTLLEDTEAGVDDYRKQLRILMEDNQTLSQTIGQIQKEYDLLHREHERLVGAGLGAGHEEEDGERQITDADPIIEAVLEAESRFPDDLVILASARKSARTASFRKASRW